MPSILLCYGTGEGQTTKVARRIAGVLADHGHAVDLVDADAPPADLDVSAYDAVVIGACLDGTSHQQSVRHFVEWNRAALSGRPSGFFQVTMGRGLTIPARQERARAFAEEFFETTGWRPDLLGLFGGALLYSTYGFLKRLRLRFSVGRETGDTDTSRDYEYTDWAEVERFAEDVVAFVDREVGEVPVHERPREAATAGGEGEVVVDAEGRTVVVD